MIDELIAAVNDTRGEDPRAVVLWADGLDMILSPYAEFLRWTVSRERRPDVMLSGTACWWAASDHKVPDYSRLPFIIPLWPACPDWYAVHDSVSDAYLAAAAEWLHPRYYILRK